MSLRYTVSAIATGVALSMAAPAIAEPSQDIVLVHGAFADGSGWRGVYDILVDEGFNVSIVQEPQTSLADDVAAVNRAVNQADGPVVLVGHSYGGQIITEAGVNPKVSALVYVAAIVPDVGESITDIFADYPSPTEDAFVPTEDGFLAFNPEKFHEGFAADLPAEDAAFMAASQVLPAAEILETKNTEAAWRTKPSYGIVAGEDMAEGAEAERFLYKRANAEVTEIEGASHAVYISHPQEVADVIMKAASK